MKLPVGNAVSSFFYYMWNAWSEEECNIVFNEMPKHFWNKWCSLADKGVFGAAERFFAELSDTYQQLLVERAVTLYDGKARRKQPEDEDVYVCEVCGSLKFEITAWVDANTNEYISDADFGSNGEWCAECNTNHSFCNLKDFKAKMQSWWASCDFKTLEQITELRKIDYPSDDGSLFFVDAANEWWNNQDYDKKRSIYKEYNSND